MRSREAPRTSAAATRPVITAIEPVASDPNLRRIKAGRKTIATLRFTDLERLTLEIGQSLTVVRTRHIMEAASLEMARIDARRILASRMLSAREARDRLARKRHAPDIIECVVRELIADGWIDEKAYGRAVIESAARARPAGVKLLKQKLRSRKVDEDTIGGLVAKSDSSDDIEVAYGFARRQWAKMSALPKPKAIRRIVGLLARRGYEQEFVAEVLRRLGIQGVD